MKNGSDSRVKKVLRLFKAKPNDVFNLQELRKAYASCYNENLNPLRASMIFTRLHRKGIIFRTKTQLDRGYCYSVSNKRKLSLLHDHYLLPYDFVNRDEIIGILNQQYFEKLKSNAMPKFSLPHFVMPRYGVLEFLTSNIGFMFGDGHLKNDKLQARYYFYKRGDAEKFKLDFLAYFPSLKSTISRGKGGYILTICKKELVVFFSSLGAPIGNKLKKEFCVPEWIYRGSDNIKRIFLATMYGNEGSKPHNNKWRIQFVLSKQREFVPNLLMFLSQIRTMLHHFSISSSYIQLRKQEGRNFSGRFYINGRENITLFYEKIGFLHASEKQETLKSLISR